MNDTQVFTSKQVVEQKKPILYVYHDADGEWQFQSGEDVSFMDAMLATMDNILALDPTIQEILTMPPGFMATRTAVGAPWETEPFEDSDD